MSDENVERVKRQNRRKISVIIGNPPFLGDKLLNRELGADYVNRLRMTYEGRVPGHANLVVYWFEKQGKCLGAKGSVPPAR